MKKPKKYNTEGILSNFIKKSSERELIRYINSLNIYIDWLEGQVDIDEDDDEEIPFEPEDHLKIMPNDLIF